MNKCIVTIAIGETYQKTWTRIYKSCMEAYAARHGYDLVVIYDYLDEGPLARARAPHWQKLLILDHPQVRKYAHAVWVDADILINHHAAPCVVTATGKTEKIGVVTYSQAEAGTPQQRDNRYNRRHETKGGFPDFSLWYRSHGIAGPDDPNIDDFINTGVLVLQPRRHAEFLRWVYDNGKENKFTHQDNGPLSYHIFLRDLAQPIDPRFNVSWNNEIIEHYPFLMSRKNFYDRKLLRLCVNAAWHNSYFLHFIGTEARSAVDLVLTERATALNLEVGD